MTSDLDFALALSLQEEFENEYKETETSKHAAMQPQLNNAPSSIVDETWELTDPNPDIHGLFLSFNDAYFWKRLTGIEVKWSPRMTLCAGLCHYEGRGGLCSVRLSLPLLKLRPRKDLVETLLHEMIHAYLFVTANNKDHDAHGPEFHKHMYRINAMAGTKITVYHTFHDEVALYKQHWWRCNGPCQKKSPFYGYVKRAINRAPSANDRWWAEHQANCNGSFIKIKEPENYGKPEKRKLQASSPIKASGGADIRKFFKTSSSKVANPTNEPSTSRPIISDDITELYFSRASHPETGNGSISEISSNSLGAKRKTQNPSGPISSSQQGSSNIRSLFSSPPRGTINGTRMNSSSTITVNKKKATKNENSVPKHTGNIFGMNDNNSVTKSTFKIFGGKGNVLGSR